MKPHTQTFTSFTNLSNLGMHAGISLRCPGVSVCLYSRCCHFFLSFYCRSVARWGIVQMKDHCNMTELSKYLVTVFLFSERTGLFCLRTISLSGRTSVSLMLSFLFNFLQNVRYVKTNSTIFDMRWNKSINQTKTRSLSTILELKNYDNVKYFLIIIIIILIIFSDQPPT